MLTEAWMFAEAGFARAQSLGGHSDSHRTVLWIAVAAVFVGLTLGLVYAYRRIRGQVELEHAERIIEAELGAWPGVPTPVGARPGVSRIDEM